MTRELDFLPSIWLINYYHIIGTISLFLNSYTLYLVLFKSEKIDSFKYNLLGFQIMCVLVDFHLTFFMQPQPLHPIPAGFTTGLLSYKNLVSTHMMMTSVIGLMGSQIGALLSCFLRKYQMFRKLKRGAKTKDHWVGISFVGYCIIVVFLIVVMYKCGMSYEEEFKIIREKYPEQEEGFRSLSEFALYGLNIYWISLLSGTFFVTCYVGIIFAYTTYSMFNILRELQKMSTTSSVNFKKQRQALISLVAQLSITFLALIPIAVFTLFLLIEFRYDQSISRICLALFCSHASVNAVVLVMTTPPFRKFTFFWMTRKRSPVIVSVA